MGRGVLLSGDGDAAALIEVASRLRRGSGSAREVIMSNTRETAEIIEGLLAIAKVAMPPDQCNHTQ